MDVNKVGCRSD